MSVSQRHLHQRVHSPVGRYAAQHPSIEHLGRAGWLAKGVVYLVAGVLALNIAARAGGWTSPASGAGQQEASPTGAIKAVADTTGGPLLLWLLAIGMFLYAAWRLISAVLPGDTDAKAIAQRVGYVVSAVLYTGLGITAIRVIGSTPAQTDGNSKVSRASSGLMDHGWGRLLVGVVGVVVIAVGVYRIVKGVRQDVNDELDLAGMSPARRRWTEVLGAVGEFGRGLGMGLVGFFLLRAAITYNPDQATGLDGALRRLATESWGLVVVLAVGIGFAAYGVFCATTFTRRRFEAPS